MPEPTPMSWVTTWTADPLGLLLAVVLTGGYAAGVLAARRRGTAWPWGRTAVYAVLGVGMLVLATCGALAAYRGTLFSVGAAQATVLSAVIPLGLALGDPLGLARAAWPPLGRGVGPGVTRLGRVAMFPLVSSVVAAAVLVVLFFTPWFAASLTSTWVRELLYVVLLLTGTLVVLPLLSTELLPTWCTHPVRAFLAFVDGLIDAVPGILVMTTPRLLTVGIGAAGLTQRTWGPAPMWDQRLGGGVMLAIAETVGLPLLGAVMVAWMRADAVEARLVDDELDARRAGAAAASGASGPEVRPAPLADGEAGRDRPWWESDPRFSRYRD
jgi:cytochrome c oxidase assembly factor CtaG